MEGQGEISCIQENVCYKVALISACASHSVALLVDELFASAKRNVTEYGDLGCYVKNFPSEGKMQAAALEVQKLLVTGRIKEALRFAQEGQLWGPALVLATQISVQFYGETVKEMALRQLTAGSPLQVPQPLKHSLSLDAVLISQNKVNRYMDDVDVFYPFIADVDLEKGKSEKPKSKIEPTTNVKTDNQ